MKLGTNTFAILDSRGHIDTGELLKEAFAKIPVVGFPDIKDWRQNPRGKLLLPFRKSEIVRIGELPCGSHERPFTEFFQKERFCESGSIIDPSRIFEHNQEVSNSVIMAFYPGSALERLSEDEHKVRKHQGNSNGILALVSEYMLLTRKWWPWGNRYSDRQVKIHFVQEGQGAVRPLEHSFNAVFPWKSLRQIINDAIALSGNIDSYSEWTLSGEDSTRVYNASRGGLYHSDHPANDCLRIDQGSVLFVAPSGWSDERLKTAVIADFLPMHLKGCTQKEGALEAENARLRSLLLSAVSERAQALLPARTSPPPSQQVPKEGDAASNKKTQG
ncbi:MAG: hypothetical protein SGARI_000439 [Bacillariaceae sp.]